MIFNTHSELSGLHAFLSPSNYYWLNYSDQKLEARFYASMSARRGTDLHKLAHEAIRLGVKLSKTNKSLATYVNDAIGYKMACEQILFYSSNCFGTADTISFRRGKLRIHDLKTGISPTSEHQLEVYAALFCLEYGVDPFDIAIELRIYQREEIKVFEPYPDTIAGIMGKIVDFDQQIEGLKASDRF
jgi:RecB family exonuclease